MTIGFGLYILFSYIPKSNGAHDEVIGEEVVAKLEEAATDGDLSNGEFGEIQPDEATSVENAMPTSFEERYELVDTPEAESSETESITEDSINDEISVSVDLGLFDYPEDSGYAWVNVFNNGVTPIIQYTPLGTNSRYFKDLGITPQTTNADYQTVDMSYFDDACWIGDSRCLGINDYSGFASDFYCDNGYCFYHYENDKTVTYQNSRSKVIIQDALSNKQYKKIYVMMGINDCGYGTTSTMHECVGNFITMLKEKQPDAVIFLCSNLHISRSAAAKADPEVYCNANINAKNLAVASFADGKSIFYLDFNDLFCDEDGFLIEELTFDGYHLYGSKYEPWVNFFLEHGIVK